MDVLKLFLLIVAGVVVGTYLASAIMWLAIITGALEGAMGFIVIAYALLAVVLAEIGLYLLLALVVGAMGFFLYKRAMIIKRHFR